MEPFEYKNKPSIHATNETLLAMHGSFHSVTCISFTHNSNRNSAEDYSDSKRNKALKELKKYKPC